jgi:hypothetical protein
MLEASGRRFILHYLHLILEALDLQSFATLADERDTMPVIAGSNNRNIVSIM